MLSKYAHCTYSNTDLINDLLKVHADLGYITQQAYDDRGRFSHQTQAKRFGSWRKACAAAGVESRSFTGRHPEPIATEPRRCLGPGPDHRFEAIRDDLTHRICDACKDRTAPDHWDRIEVADGWEVVGA